MRPCCALVRGRIAFHTPDERAALAIAGAPCECGDRLLFLAAKMELIRLGEGKRSERERARTGNSDQLAQRAPGSILARQQRVNERCRLRMRLLACNAILVNDGRRHHALGNRLDIGAICVKTVEKSTGTGRWVYHAEDGYGGTQPTNSLWLSRHHAYEWATDAVLCVASPDGRCWVWAAQIDLYFVDRVCKLTHDAWDKQVQLAVVGANLSSARPIFDAQNALARQQGEKAVQRQCNTLWARVQRVRSAA